LVGRDPTAWGRGTLDFGGFARDSKGDAMKKSATIVSTFAIACILAGGVLAGQNLMTGKCVKVLDGDTLIIECEKTKRTVDIEGIDAPELDQPWGKEVRNFVKDMVRGREVQVEIIESTPEMVRARVTVNGVDLSELLVSRGLAWVPEGSADSDLVALGTKAKEYPCGLWTDSEPEPPWEFRAAQS
jgi:micrococcal nuclease